MSSWTRRGVVAGLASSIAACSATNLSGSRNEIDQSVDQAMAQMFETVPGSLELAQSARGMLMMPRVGKVGLIVGGSYGEGALIIGNAKVDYFSIATANIGFQAGVQQSSHALFFMTGDSLADFRSADGWEVGVDAEIVVYDQGDGVSVTSTNTNKPVHVIYFNQEGLLAGATLEGAKYSRLVR
jgi:lipid-binding SYLF domain-containing protein